MITTLGKYTIGKTLGSGVSCKVKVGRGPNGTKYAIKLLKDDDAFKDLISTEVQILRKLHHDHIVNFIEMGNDLMKKEKKSKQVDYIVLELA